MTTTQHSALSTQHSSAQHPVVDPTTLAVVQGWLEQIADEMDTVLARSAFSTVIAEQFDRACGVYQADDGGTIVQGHTGLPVFVGTQQFAVRAVIEKATREGTRVGDVYMLNDPYVTGTHLHDVRLVRPFFYEGELVCWLAATGHWMDIGSAQPGGWSSQVTDARQEGLRIPPVKLCHGGELDADLLDLILANIRLPTDARGDCQAALNALHVGDARLSELFARYGGDTVRAAIAELRARAEQHMRSYLAELPDGTWTFEDFVDDDGLGSGPLRIHLTLTIAGSGLRLDFSGSSPPCRGPANLSAQNTITACFIALKHLFPDLPLSAGCFAPIEFVIPPSTFLAVEYPRPQGGYLDVTNRVMDTVLGAMAQAAPARAMGAPYSTLPIFGFAGTQPDSGRYYVGVLFAGGGYGGSATGDGLNNGALPIGIARTAPMEIMERRFPLRYRHFALRPDSGGAGAHRGGCGVDCEVELLGESAEASNMADRQRFAPFGVLGGGAGAHTELVVTQGGVPRVVTKEAGLDLRRGDRITLRYPGGGGYGDPQERAVSLLARDLRAGYVTEAAARAAYGAALVDAALALPEPR